MFNRGIPSIKKISMMCIIGLHDWQYGTRPTLGKMFGFTGYYKCSKCGKEKA